MFFKSSLYIVLWKYLLFQIISKGILTISNNQDLTNSTSSKDLCEFQCLDQSKCIQITDRCDGYSDCDDGSDELNCTNECQPTMFKCNDGSYCVERIYMCDGTSDCDDSSDEFDCLNKTKCNFENDFMCKSNKQCIIGDLRCDGTHHCPDLSDEEDCQYSCNEMEFNCTHGTPLCIPLDKHCNGQHDCHNGNDELNCDISHILNDENTCLNNNGGCSHECVVNLNGGHYCNCPHGFQLEDNHKTCKDMDECLSHGCSHICLNTEGSYECQCNKGYQLGDDAHMCLATLPQPYLFVTNGTKLIRLGLRSEIEDEMEMHATISSLDADAHNSELYYIQLNNKHIYRSFFKGVTTPLITDQLESPVSLTFDWINRNLYWADAGHVAQRARIEVISVESKLRTTLVTAPAINTPLAIVVDPREQNQFLYWSQGGVNTGIYRAGLDGSHHTTLITKDIKHPGSLVLDFVSEKLYWMDMHMNQVSSLELIGEDLDRSIVHTLHERHNNIAALASFEDWLYWVDGASQKVVRVHRYDGEMVNFLFDYSSEDYAKSDASLADSSLMSNRYVQSRITYILHPLRQIPEENICSVHANYNCSHLCIRTSTFEGYACFCPNSPNKQSTYVMDEERRICTLTYHTSSTSTLKTVPTKLSLPERTTVSILKSDAPNANTPSNVMGDQPLNKEEEPVVSSPPIWIYIVIGTVAVVVVTLIFIGYKLYKRREEKKMLFENPMFEPLRKNGSKQKDANKTTQSLV